MILAEDSIHFLASKKKIEFLRNTENQKSEDTGVPPVKLLVRDRVRVAHYIRKIRDPLFDLLIILRFFLLIFQNDEDKANFAKLIEVIQGSKKGKTLGVFSKENYPGPFMDAWRAALKSKSFDTVRNTSTTIESVSFLIRSIDFQVDVSAAAAYVMCPKEDMEILAIKKACLVSVDVFTKYLKDQIMEIIDSDKVIQSAGQIGRLNNNLYPICRKLNTLSSRKG